MMAAAAACLMLVQAEEIGTAQASRVEESAADESGGNATPSARMQPAAQLVDQQPSSSGDPAMLGDSLPGPHGALQQINSNLGEESSTGLLHDGSPDSPGSSADCQPCSLL